MSVDLLASTTGDPWSAFLESRGPSRWLYLFAFAGDDADIQRARLIDADVQVVEFGEATSFPFNALGCPPGTSFVGAAVPERRPAWDECRDCVSLCVQRARLIDPEPVFVRMTSRDHTATDGAEG